MNDVVKLLRYKSVAFVDSYVKIEERLNTYISTHVKIHIFMYYCSNNFDQNNQIVSHLKICTRVKNNSWNPCGIIFRQSNNLIRHMTTHPGVKNSSCNQFGKSLNQRSNMITYDNPHRMKHHSFNQCVKCLRGRGQLITHMTTHTGKKSFLWWAW